MLDQLLSELRKMRSTRTNIGLLTGMIALILLTVLLNGFIPQAHELAKHDNQHMLLSAGTSAALFVALIGVMAITSEFRHGTIRPTFVVSPQRTRVITANTWLRSTAPRPTPSAAHAAVIAGVPSMSQTRWPAPSSSGMSRTARIP